MCSTMVTVPSGLRTPVRGDSTQARKIAVKVGRTSQVLTILQAELTGGPGGFRVASEGKRPGMTPGLPT